MKDDILVKLIKGVLAALLVLGGFIAFYLADPLSMLQGETGVAELSGKPGTERRAEAGNYGSGNLGSEPSGNEGDGSGTSGEESTESEGAEENNLEDGSQGEGGGLRSDIKDENAEGYIAAQEDEIQVPEAVSGRSGYQPVQDVSEQVDGQQDGPGVGETGDGLVFPEDIYPYYQMLDEKGKHLYRQIYANAQALNADFRPVEEVSVDSIRDIFSAVHNDHPELFWLDVSYSCKYNPSKVCVEMGLSFNQAADNLEEAKAVFSQSASGILAQAQGSAYEKERVIHNLLMGQVEYDLGAAMNQSAYSALVNGRSVCAGYSRAFQYLMQEAGIPCYYCTGYAGESHAWNIVGLEDGFYNVDVTWDDVPGGEYEFFNQSDEDFAGTHLRKELSVYLPPCNGQQYRSLEQSSGNPELRTLEDVGLTEEAVNQDIQEYFADCGRQILEIGLGDYAFYSVLEGEDLLQEWYRAYETESYKQEYLEEAMTALGATSFQVNMEVEELRGGQYLITHHVQLR